MNIKIQGGGGGVYSNSGSSFGTASYLEHEDVKLMKEGEREQFFTHEGKTISKGELVKNIDSNKAKLSKADAKYFVITVSPSKKELAKMGSTPVEQSKALKEYINEKVMPSYAENFNKGLTEKDIMYYGKVHHERGVKGKGNLHAHIIVSRKDMNNKIKISPSTNHRGTEKGAVKGGFDRNSFFEKCEKDFDKKFDYDRDTKESYRYCNTLKNGTQKERRKIIESEIVQEKLALSEKNMNKLDDLKRKIDDMKEEKFKQFKARDEKFRQELRDKKETTNEVIQEKTKSREVKLKFGEDPLDKIKAKEQEVYNSTRKVDHGLDFKESLNNDRSKGRGFKR